jgi:hypothetical protein
VKRKAMAHTLLMLLLAFCLVVPVQAASSWSVQTVDVNGAGISEDICPIVIDSKNNPHIAYTDFINNENLVKYAKWDGSGWSVQTVDYGRVYGLALDNRGNPHIVYIFGSSITNSGGLRYDSRTGSNWNIQTVDQRFSRGRGSVALDSSGNPHIAYIDKSNVLKYASRVGSNWRIEILDNAEYIWPTLSLEFGSNNTPYIVYGFYYMENGTKTAKMAFMKNSSWSIQTVASNLTNFGNMVLDSEGHPHFFYQINSPASDDSDNPIVEHASWNGSAWNTQPVALDTMGFLALDAHDNPSIAYIQSYEKVIYASWTGIAWKIQTIDSNITAIWGCHLAVDANGNPHISYLAQPPEAKPISLILYVMYATAEASTFAPSIKVLSIVDKLYDTNSIPLNFTIDEPASQIAYSLDGQENITITGNITLTGLANGDHDLTIYATDETGNVGASETSHFTVEVSFPTTLVAVTVVTVGVVVGAWLLVYFKKRKR